MLAEDFIRQEAFINGCWVDSHDKKTFPVTNPATGVLLSEVACCGVKELAFAIKSAQAAQHLWSQKTAYERADTLLEIYYKLIERQDPLAKLLTQEQGKPLAEAKGEILFAASFFRWFAEEARRSYGEVIPTTKTDCRYITVKKPIGVCAAITPWNFPIGMLARKIAPALAAGCSIIVKPAEQTPLTALAFAQIIDDLKIMPGLVNIVTTDAETAPIIGEKLCASPEIRLISFTGSTNVGKGLYRHSAENVKKLALELGGNAPFLVFEDADIPIAVQGLINSRFRNAGQTCVSANRIFVHQTIHRAFVETLVTAIKQQLKLGNGLEAGITMGPLIDQQAVEKVKILVEDALQKGATLASDKKVFNSATGLFYPPIVLTGITPAMKIHDEEIFGPVISIIEFSNEEAVIAQANDTQSGLAAYAYTKDIKRISRLSDQLEYGMVGINYSALSTAEIPFGGVKESGLGREGGRQGLEEYQEIQYLCLGV
ncbi:MAG: NAD-dependent succinate-semialdehyde dehydrogenase [Zymomonas mobilis subsp. pomaceae]|uniref:NAD-dependent succinate-semialdehyde dehydrogenase n=1 Tax=Zymomonas mobilis TaxID=542 RepID=UPI0039E844EA